MKHAFEMEYMYPVDEKTSIEMMPYSSKYQDEYRQIYNACYHEMREALQIEPFDYILDCAFKNREISNLMLLTLCEKYNHGTITDNHGQKCPFPYLKTCDIITIRNRCKGKTSVAFLYIRP